MKALRCLVCSASVKVMLAYRFWELYDAELDILRRDAKPRARVFNGVHRLNAECAALHFLNSCLQVSVWHRSVDNLPQSAPTGRIAKAKRWSALWSDELEISPGRARFA
jgi:hypothetical protein